MLRLRGKLVRRTAAAALRKLNTIYEPIFGRKFLLKDIDDCLHTIDQDASKGAALNLNHLKEQFSLGYLSVACTGLLALSLYENHHKDQLFPVDWLHTSKLPNANHILQCMLTQLSNFTLSATVLLEKGLDNPARAMCRLIAELSHQILIVTYSREDFQTYIEGTDEKSSTKTWHTLFARGKLSRRLSEIEEKLGLNLELGSYLKEMRRENYEFYSQAVHHSFIANTIGAYSSKFNDTNLQFGLFGGENSTIASTLRYLNFSLWYFFLVFFAILAKHHKVHPKNPKSGFWLEAFMLHFCIKDAFLVMYNVDDQIASQIRQP